MFLAGKHLLWFEIGHGFREMNLIQPTLPAEETETFGIVTRIRKSVIILPLHLARQGDH